MNKKLLFRCLISTSLCFLAFINVSAQTDWFFVALTSSRNVIYIDKNFSKVRGGITRVWQKTVTPDDNYTISLTEWNCAEKSFRFVQSSVYENDVITNRSNTKTAWRYFVPDSTAMLLYSNICPQKQTKKNDNSEALKSNSEQEFWAAEIIVEKTALMSRADSESRVLRRVALGEKFIITGEEPVGIWYRVFDRKTNKLGWLDGGYFKIVENEKPVKKTTGKKSTHKKKN